MPYLPGYSLVDDSDVQLTDDSDVPYAEEDADLTWLSVTVLAQLTEILNRIGTPSSTLFQDIAGVGGDVAAVATQVTGVQVTTDDALYAAQYAALIAAYVAAAKIDPVWGPAVVDGVVAIADKLGIGLNQTDVGSPVQPQVAGIVDGTYPVTPVTPPPEGYGGQGLDDIAAAVWGYRIGNQEMGGSATTQQADVVVSGIKAALELTGGQAGFTDSRNPFFSLVARDVLRAREDIRGQWGDLDYQPPLETDWSAWDGEDSLVDFLTAQHPSFTWLEQGPDGQATPGIAWAHVGSGSLEHYWRCNVPEYMLPYVSGRGLATQSPPIWPGLANVTLAEPVPFHDVIEVTGPMDGILVQYTTPPQSVSKWTVGSFTNYGFAGQLAFTSDNGYAEPWQYLQWDKQVYVPRALSVAATVLIYPKAGQEGTITPWTRI
jgi:hypothetical protein